MDYQMTENELIQALNRVRIHAEETTDATSLSLMRPLIACASDPQTTRNYLYDLNPEQVARLDWALER